MTSDNFNSESFHHSTPLYEVDENFLNTCCKDPDTYITRFAGIEYSQKFSWLSEHIKTFERAINQENSTGHVIYNKDKLCTVEDFFEDIMTKYIHEMLDHKDITEESLSIIPGKMFMKGFHLSNTKVSELTHADLQVITDYIEQCRENKIFFESDDAELIKKFFDRFNSYDEHKEKINNQTKKIQESLVKTISDEKLDLEVQEIIGKNFEDDEDE